MATKNQKGANAQLERTGERKVDEVEDGQLIRMWDGEYKNQVELKEAHVTNLADTFTRHVSFVRGVVNLVDRAALCDDPHLPLDLPTVLDEVHEHLDWIEIIADELGYRLGIKRRGELQVLSNGKGV